MSSGGVGRRGAAWGEGQRPPGPRRHTESPNAWWTNNRDERKRDIVVGAASWHVVFMCGVLTGRW